MNRETGDARGDRWSGDGGGGRRCRSIPSPIDGAVLHVDADGTSVDVDEEFVEITASKGRGSSPPASRGPSTTRTPRRWTGNPGSTPPSRRTVERHDGEIPVESTPRTGSTFYFTLPVEVERDG